MAGVATRPDHRDQHPGVAQATLLVIGVDGEHHDLA
jgi:hypothetical protein